MDDPWGSPWTTSDASSANRAAGASGSRAKSHSIASSQKGLSATGLEPPPRAFLSPATSPYATPALGASHGLSPWADDDWTSPPSGLPTGANSSGLGGGFGGGGAGNNIWADAHLSPRLTPAPRDDPFLGAKPSPVACPGNVAISRSNSFIRLPPLDPWSAEISIGHHADPLDDSTSTPRPILRDPIATFYHLGAPFADVTDKAKSIVPRNTEKDEHVESRNRSRSSRKGTQARAHDATVHEPAPLDRVTHYPREPPPTDGSAESQPGTIESRSSSLKSRPTSPSDGGNRSDAEPERQDSPITSIDEEVKTSRPRTRAGRRTSGKIQPLVDKFDSLAQVEHQERHGLGRERSSSSSRPAAPRARTRDGVAEGNEPGDIDGRRARGHNQAVLATDSKRPGTPVRPAGIPLPSPSPPRARSPPSPLVRLVPAQFDIDYELVGRLLDGTSDDVKELEQDKIETYVPDRVIHDSFTEISERKAWYRVSRQGSIWRHSNGDGESYRRAGWPSSVTRAETLKTVRRWMEEDSIAGRVTLGGGASKGHSMFGWGSSEAPVSLEDVFKKKRGHKAEEPPPAFSKAPVAGVRQKRPDHVPVQSRMSGIAPPPAASFGWSSAALAEPPITPATPAGPIPTGPPGSAVAGRPYSKPSATAPLTPPLSQAAASPEAVVSFQPASMLAITIPRDQQEGHADDDDDDDDDEWGEMVTSPTGEARPPEAEFGTISGAFGLSPTERWADDLQEEQAALDILAGLADLSYMLA